MTTELPADIAAAIEELALTERTVGVALGNRATNFANGPHRHAADAARAALVAAILARLTVAAEDDAEATCQTIAAEALIRGLKAMVAKLEAERDTLRAKLDEMHACLRLAEGSCAKLREEIAGLRGSHECVEQHLEDVCAENERLREAIQSAVTEAKDLSGRLHRSHAWNQSAVSSWLANHAGKLERAALSPAAEEAKLPGLWNTLAPDQQRRILESGDDV